MAEAAYKSITPRSVVTITKVKRGKVFQQAPLLYDLTALQKDCNIHYDLPVDKTLAITQSLYEKKLVSYPRQQVYSAGCHGAHSGIVGKDNSHAGVP